MSAQGLPAHILALFTPRWGRKWKAVGPKGKFQLAMTLRNVKGKHVAHRMSLLCSNISQNASTVTWIDFPQMKVTFSAP